MPNKCYTAHLDMDTFFVSVERLHNPNLQGKPVIIGGLSDRGVVAACSYEARKFGIHSAMPMKRARLLCSDAIIVRGDWDSYAQKSEEVTEIIAAYVPEFEKTSIDEHYLDLSGYERFYGAFQWAHSLRERIRKETGLPISMGFSPNKTVSKIATKLAKPDGERRVYPQEITQFLAPLSISAIPGMGQKLSQHFTEIGIYTIAQLAALPMELVVRIAGKVGVKLWEKAQGIDNSPVVPYNAQKSISKELTFQADTLDLRLIKNVLVTMAEALGYELRRKGKMASTLSLKIRYANFDTHTRDLKISYTAADHVLIERARQLLDKLYDRRMMIRLIGLKVSGLIQGYPQMSLFEDASDNVELYNKLDRIRNKFGEKAVFRACGIDAHRENEAQQLAKGKALPAGNKRGSLFPYATPVATLAANPSAIPQESPAANPVASQQLPPEAQALLKNRFHGYYGMGGAKR